MSSLPTLESMELSGRRVLLRLDLNVPLQDGVVTSQARIRAALPTIRHLLEKDARIGICSHLGRPKNKKDTQFSLEPVGSCLAELLETEVLLSDSCHGDGVRSLLRKMRSGSVLLLENLRYNQGEVDNDPEFSRRLAEPFEAYVNDAFGVCHRKHASVVSAPKCLDQAGMGFLVAQEVQALLRLRAEPAQPFVAVVGGAKVSDKLGILQALLGRAQTLCIGGAMAYTFLRAMGHSIGDSRCEEDKVHLAKEILERAHGRTQIILPVDHVAAAGFAVDAAPVHVASSAISDGFMGLDIGANTRKQIVSAIEKAHTVFWNGPMGVFEWPAFAAGTHAVAAAVAACPGETVVGGGDSVAAIEAAGVVDKITHVSTGGGASLALLQDGSLPGLDALR